MNLGNRNGRTVRPFGKVLLKSVLPIAFWTGFLIAMLAPVVYPPALTLGSPLLCDGTLEQVNTPYSLPGESGVVSSFFCTGESGSVEISTMALLAVNFAIYGAIAFALLALIGLLVRRRLGAEAGQPVPEKLRGYFGGDARTTVSTHNITLEGSDADALVRSLSALAGGAGQTTRTSRTVDLSNADLDTKLRTIAGLRAEGLIDDESYQKIVAKIREKG